LGVRAGARAGDALRRRGQHDPHGMSGYRPEKHTVARLISAHRLCRLPGGRRLRWCGASLPSCSRDRRTRRLQRAPTSLATASHRMRPPVNFKNRDHQRPRISAASSSSRCVGPINALSADARAGPQALRRRFRPEFLNRVVRSWSSAP
jgi:hypothetical protein